MARSTPLYTLEDQYTKLDTDFASTFPALNIAKYRLLMACSAGCTLDSAKNRFLNLIQDTELKTTFSSLLEIPDSKETTNINSIYSIHLKYQANYGLITKILKELGVLGIPRYTIDMYDKYFYGNEDPVYKLSVTASAIMMGYIKDDQINNRK